MYNLEENLKNYLYIDSFKISNKIYNYPIFKKEILYDKCLIIYLEYHYYNNKVLDFLFLNFPYLYRLKNFTKFIKEQTVPTISKLNKTDLKEMNIGVNFDYTEDVLFTENFEFISTMDDEGSFVMYFSPKLKEKFIKYMNGNKKENFSSNLYISQYFNEYTNFLYQHYYKYLFL